MGEGIGGESEELAAAITDLLHKAALGKIRRGGP